MQRIFEINPGFRRKRVSQGLRPSEKRGNEVFVYRPSPRKRGEIREDR